MVTRSYLRDACARMRRNAEKGEREHFLQADLASRDEPRSFAQHTHRRHTLAFLAGQGIVLRRTRSLRGDPDAP